MLVPAVLNSSKNRLSRGLRRRRIDAPSDLPRGSMAPRHPDETSSPPSVRLVGGPRGVNRAAPYADRVVAPAVSPESSSDSPAAQDKTDERSPRWHVLVRMLVAAAAGVLLYLSGPPRTLWWFAPIAFAVLGWLIQDRRARAGFGYALCFGLGYFVPLLAWTGEFVGLVAWLPLALAEALLVGLSGAAIAVVTVLPAWPVWAALLWVAGEALRSVFPFGGFPWGNIAFTQPEGVYLPLATVAGTPLIALAVTLTGFGLTALASRLVRRETAVRAAARARARRRAAGRRRLRRAAAGRHGRQRRRGDGRGRAGQRAARGPGLQRPAPGRARQPRRPHHQARRRRRRRPRTQAGPGDLAGELVGHRSRTATPTRGTASSAPPARSTRRSPSARCSSATTTCRATRCCCGSRSADRSTSTPSASCSRSARPCRGARSSACSPPPWTGRASSSRATRRRSSTWATPGSGLATCYEVAFDGVVRDSAKGSNLLAVPTNNATFGYTEMTYQQLAMDRVRAVEHGRDRGRRGHQRGQRVRAARTAR